MLFGRDLFGKDPLGRSLFGDNFATTAPFEAFIQNKDSDLAFIVDARPWGRDQGFTVFNGILDATVLLSLLHNPVNFIEHPILFTDFGSLVTCHTFGSVVDNKLFISDDTDPLVAIGSVFVRSDSVGNGAIIWPTSPPSGGVVTALYDKGAVVERGYQDYERPLYFRDTDRAFPAIVRTALSSRNDAFVGVGDNVSSGGTSANFSLAIADGAHDEWADFQVDGREFSVLLGSYTFDFFEFQPVFKGVGQSKTWGLDTLTVTLRDNSEKLSTPLQTTFYLGDELTNPLTLEGGVSIKSLRKPRCFGEAKNIPVVQVNRGFLCYQFNDGPVKGVDALYDKGVALTPQPDGIAPPADPAAPIGSVQRLGFADVFAWVGAVPGPASDPPLTAGNYIFDLSNGVIRTNGTATGIITADVKGDVGDVTLGASGYVELAGDLIRRLISIEGTLDKINDVELSELNQLQIDNNAPLQLYYDGSSPVSVLEAVDTIINSIGAMREFTRNGLLSANIVKYRTPVAVFDERNIVQIQSFESDIPTSVPVHSMSFGYAESYIVQENEPEDILPGPQPPSAAQTAHKEFVAAGYRRITEPTQGIHQDEIDKTIARRPLSVEIVIDSKLSKIVMFGTPVHERFNLLEADNFHYTLRVLNQRFLRRVGQTVTIKYPRWGLSAGKNFIILGIEEDSNTLQTTFRVWGGEDI